MTLSTKVYFLDPINPLDVHAYCNELLGAPATVRFEQKDTDYSGNPRPSISNEPMQGLPAWLFVHYGIGDAPRQELCTDPTHFGEDSDDNEEKWDCEHSHFATHHVMVDFDTAYSYRDALGGCTELHARFIFQLADWAAERKVRIGWKNEFTGDCFHGTEGLGEFIGSGEDAMDWFRNIVLPAITSHIGEVEL